MRRDKRKWIIIIAAIVAVLLVSVGTAVLINSTQPKKQDPYKQATDSQPVRQGSTPSESDSTAKETPSPSKPTEPALDPATVGVIDVASMNITVSYSKGVGGFEYEVLRTPSGTQYAEFRSPDLIGTKCTDDLGTFASILADPQSNESLTLAKTTMVGETKYGLSLASNTCTSDTTKLKDYQDSFNAAFSLLKKTD